MYAFMIPNLSGKVHFISINQSAVAVGADEGKFEAAIAVVENRDGLAPGGNPQPNLNLTPNPPPSPSKRHGRE
jgi:hypothetical protein